MRSLARMSSRASKAARRSSSGGRCRSQAASRSPSASASIRRSQARRSERKDANGKLRIGNGWRVPMAAMFACPALCPLPFAIVVVHRPQQARFLGQLLPRFGPLGQRGPLGQGIERGGQTFDDGQRRRCRRRLPTPIGDWSRLLQRRVARATAGGRGGFAAGESSARRRRRRRARHSGQSG